MNLYENLEKYKTLTLELINQIENDGKVEVFIEKREDILKAISSAVLDSKEIKIIEKELKLLELEDKLKDLVNEKKSKVMKEIIILKKSKQANKKYNTLENVSIVLNETI